MQNQQNKLSTQILCVRRDLSHLLLLYEASSEFRAFCANISGINKRLEGHWQDIEEAH